MKTIYTLLLAVLLAPLATSAEELDQERLKRIDRRFGKLVKIETSQAAGVPELPVEPESTDKEKGWGLFNREDDSLSRQPATPSMQRRYIRSAPQADKDDSGWGWLHADVLKEKEKRDAAMAASEEAARPNAEEAWRSSAMSEEEIQRAVSMRLKQEPVLLSPNADEDEMNPLKQLPQYKAMSRDYRSPAQKMLSPEYTRARLNQLQNKQDDTSTLTKNRFEAPTLPSQQQSSGITTPYGQSSSMFSELRKSSTLPRASTITPRLNQPTSGITDPYSTPKRTIRDLRKLPSMEEQDPFEDSFPKARRSIWDD